MTRKKGTEEGECDFTIATTKKVVHSNKLERTAWSTTSFNVKNLEREKTLRVIWASGSVKL